MSDLSQPASSLSSTTAKATYYIKSKTAHPARRGQSRIPHCGSRKNARVPAVVHTPHGECYSGIAEYHTLAHSLCSTGKGKAACPPSSSEGNGRAQHAAISTMAAVNPTTARPAIALTGDGPPADRKKIQCDACLVHCLRQTASRPPLFTNPAGKKNESFS